MHNRKAAFQLENAELTNAINDHAQRLEQSEKQVRALALTCYDLDPTETKPAEGVSVITAVSYDYTPEAALAWVKASAPHLLIESYHVASVKKAAAAGLLPFATRVETPAVRIASDLSEYARIPEPSHE